VLDASSRVFNPFAQLVDPEAAAEVTRRPGGLQDLAVHIHRVLEESGPRPGRTPRPSFKDRLDNLRTAR
jgi:hypothetical protein